MKCFTVTEDGISPGIQLSDNEPYPHVGVGDPRAAYNYRRIKLDEDLANTIGDGTLDEASIKLDVNDDDRRRASYSLAPPVDGEDGKVLVKIEVRPDDQEGRTYYTYPRDTFTVAAGELTRARKHILAAPSQLVVLKDGDEVQIYKIGDIWKKEQLIKTVKVKGGKLK